MSRRPTTGQNLHFYRKVPLNYSDGNTRQDASAQSNSMKLCRYRCKNSRCTFSHPETNRAERQLNMRIMSIDRISRTYSFRQLTEALRRRMNGYQENNDEVKKFNEEQLTPVLDELADLLKKQKKDEE